MNPSPAPSKDEKDENKPQEGSNTGLYIGIGVSIAFILFVVAIRYFGRQSSSKSYPSVQPFVQPSVRVQPFGQPFKSSEQSSTAAFTSFAGGRAPHISGHTSHTGNTVNKNVLQRQLNNVKSLQEELRRKQSNRNTNIQLNTGRYLIEQGKTKEGEEMFRRAFPDVSKKR